MTKITITLKPLPDGRYDYHVHAASKDGTKREEINVARYILVAINKAIESASEPKTFESFSVERDVS